MSFPSDPPRQFHLQTLLVSSQIGLLLAVLLGFGTTTYYLVRRGIFEQAESDILGAARLVMEQMQNASAAEKPEIDALYAEKFGLAPRDHAYLFTRDAAGREARRGDFPTGWGIPTNLKPDRRPFHSRGFQQFLDVWLQGPKNELVLVGRPLAKEFDRLNRVRLSLFLAGWASLAAGVGLSYMIARRTVAPLQRLTQNAESITPNRLDQRLSSDSRVSEISRLEGVLNSMLSRLDAAFRRQTQFTADASHELRTPVTIVMSQAEHALAKPRTDAEYRFALETCLSAGRSMRTLIESLLALARTESAPPQLLNQPVRFDRLVIETCRQLQPLAGERGVTLRHEVSEAMVRGDASQLIRVIDNLVTNAIVYNNPNGEVVVKVASERGQTVLTVADTGIGISFLDQQRLFERFFRADASRGHGRGQGAGLGLSIVREIVQAHRGAIEVTSELGSGTTFTVRFPVEASNGVSPTAKV